ncbi:hypothetical protein NEE14_002740 [Parabacteroides sp. AD58]|uniref:Type II toxin-antitoxin system HicB family antitoxin n=1 Tax=Parabacteroides absconsus TaxID=2951805 RepID=A0ABZ2IS35_9BACT|nr:hypothetical protein [Parabacteroides sp. AD58]MCM6902074.1 hypothetical protein [Parabacteroides sp. AD58]
MEEIEKNMQEAIAFYLESCEEKNITPVEVLQGEFTLKFKDPYTKEWINGKV